MIIIVTKKNYQPEKKDITVISDIVELVSDYQLLYNNKKMSFDYLIIEDLSLCSGLDKTGMLLDEGIPVTNYVFATSLDNIYYGDIDIALEDLLAIKEE